MNIILNFINNLSIFLACDAKYAYFLNFIIYYSISKNGKIITTELEYLTSDFKKNFF